MSEVFDPEKVERIGWYYADAAGDDGWWPRVKGKMEDPALTVRAADYDKLLALYRGTLGLAGWIDIAAEKPEDCEPVIVFYPPRRLMAQYVGHIRPETPWNMMDGEYLPADAIVLWAKLPPHPYDKEQS